MKAYRDLLAFYWRAIRDVVHLGIYHRHGPCYRCRLDARMDRLRQITIPPR